MLKVSFPVKQFAMAENNAFSRRFQAPAA
jgi:hypothetical protein